MIGRPHGNIHTAFHEGTQAPSEDFDCTCYVGASILLASLALLRVLCIPAAMSFDCLRGSGSSMLNTANYGSAYARSGAHRTTSLTKVAVHRTYAHVCTAAIMTMAVCFSFALPALECYTDSCWHFRGYMDSYVESSQYSGMLDGSDMHDTTYTEVPLDAVNREDATNWSLNDTACAFDCRRDFELSRTTFQQSCLAFAQVCHDMSPDSAACSVDTHDAWTTEFVTEVNASAEILDEDEQKDACTTPSQRLPQLPVVFADTYAVHTTQLNLDVTATLVTFFEEMTDVCALKYAIAPLIQAMYMPARMMSSSQHTPQLPVVFADSYDAYATQLNLDVTATVVPFTDEMTDVCALQSVLEVNNNVAAFRFDDNYDALARHFACHDADFSSLGLFAAALCSSAFGSLVAGAFAALVKQRCKLLNATPLESGSPPPIYGGLHELLLL
eukprot:2823204-Amphidinium_carterae.2